MSRPAKISPLRVTSVEEAQRAIDQLTQKVNELSERSTNVVNSDGKSDTQGTSIRIAKTFDPDSKLVIPHKLGRPYTGWRSLNGVQFTEVPNQSNKRAQLELLMVPWVYPHETAVLSSEAQNISVTGLKGDLELSYRLELYYLEGSGGGNTLQVYVNGAAPANLETQHTYSNAAIVGTASSNGTFIKHTGNGNVGFFQIEVQAVAVGSTTRRVMYCRSAFGDGTAANTCYWHSASIHWSAASGTPEITSLGIQASVANGFDAASYLRCVAQAPQTREALIEVF